MDDRGLMSWEDLFGKIMGLPTTDETAKVILTQLATRIKIMEEGSSDKPKKKSRADRGEDPEWTDLTDEMKKMITEINEVKEKVCSEWECNFMESITEKSSEWGNISGK